MGRQEAKAGGPAVLYCIVPQDLAQRLHEPLRRHFGSDPRVHVVVERRVSERRATPARRQAAPTVAENEQQAAPTGAKRRMVRLPEGRRVAERRSMTVTVSPPPLPRALRRHAARLTFVERVLPSSRAEEDHDAARLVTRFQAGDATAFDELYMRYFEFVYSYLRVLLRDSHEAEDVAQTAFSRIFHALPTYQERGRPFRAWLFVIARNCAYDQLERTRRHRELRETEDPVDMGPEPGSDEPEHDRLEWVSDPELMLFLERLPLVQRQVLFLRFVMELTHEETAHVLGRSPDSVRTLQKRALRYLRERLTAVGARCGRRGRMGLRRYPHRQPVLRARLLSLHR